MGKPTGFKEYAREAPAHEAVPQRVTHYGEFMHRYDAAALDRQSARCMDCGVPFCQSGCPLGNLIPEFNEAVYRQHWHEAFEILDATNNFPEFTGRVCPAPCESACVLGINQPPVAIEHIEKHIIEIAFEKGYVKVYAPLLRTGKKVAIVGSGPAGLAAAAQLNKDGHSVTVYERDDEPGGLLRYGIPDFKLAKDIVDRRIELMKAEGVAFKTKAHVGVNVYFSELTDNYDAVILAGGATVPRTLPIPGSDLDGVHFAMDFLKQQNKRVAGKPPVAPGTVESNMVYEEITATGKHVIIIGSGDTGSDCVGTGNRQGAASITQLGHSNLPPLERTEFTPWPLYPHILRTSTSHEEGCDRVWAIVTKEFLGDENGRLRALRVVDVQWTQTSDGRTPANYTELTETERELPCDLALLALGFERPEHEAILERADIATDDRGNVAANTRDYKTNKEKIFSCGDMRRGQSLVVWAMAEGRACAQSVSEYLAGKY
ncbi:MAG: glutamate synthase subunit beta [Edaphocola sp.]